MSKRSPSSDGEDANSAEDDVKPSTAKRQRLVFEPVRLLAISGVSDIDERVDRFKFYKLSERLRHKDRLLNEERKKNERLNARQDRDDNTLCAINRHWNRLDEDIRLILLRDGFDESLPSDEGEAESSADFLGQLAQMEDEECEKRYDSRVQHTLRMATRLSEIRVKRSEQFHSICKKLNKFMESKADAQEKEMLTSEMTSRLLTLAEENKQLNKAAHKFQTEHRDMNLKLKEKEDRIALLETKKEELQTLVEEKEFELEKAWRREDKLEYHLAQLARQLQQGVCQKTDNGQPSASKVNGVHADPSALIPSSKLEELQSDVEHYKELLAARLQEMTELSDRNAELAAQLEKANMDLKTLPSEVVKESQEYTTLLAYYSVMVEEANRIKEQNDILSTQMAEMQKTHEEQIKNMEDEEDLAQRRLTQNTADVEAQLNQVRREYEMLRIEFEQTLAANEHHGPNAFDYRATIATLTAQHQQMRAESNKFKSKWKHAVTSVAKAQREFDAERKVQEKYIMIPFEQEDLKELGLDQNLPKNDEHGNGDEIAKTESGPTAPDGKDPEWTKLEAELRRVRVERDRLVETSRSFMDRKERAKYWGEEASRRIRTLEEQVDRTKKQLETKMAEEEGLMNEMEQTGQAYEELQENHQKLVNQMKEKEDQNLKMMTDRIYMSQTHNKLKEEKGILEESLAALTNTLHAQQLELNSLRDALSAYHERTRKLDEEKARLSSAVDNLRRSQLAESKKNTELKGQYDRLSINLKEVQLALQSKVHAHEKAEFRMRRYEEDVNKLQKQVERAKKSIQVGSTEKILLEEIRTYKDDLNCPSCKVNKKDGVLTKCFHVFCMDCLKTRYETRRRKCPKCNAAFGANDFHRLYFS